MEDSKLAADEARREVQHESVKSQVESDVNAEIATRADHCARPCGINGLLRLVAHRKTAI